MASIEITGGKNLSGSIKIAGNKNSVLPIMAACLLTKETCILENVPNISDVTTLAKLLMLANVAVEGLGTSKLKVCAKNLSLVEFPQKLTEKLRASILLIGPIIARTGQIKMGYPGGDVIGRRPLDTHVLALGKLGAVFSEPNDHIVVIAKNLKGCEITLKEASVTATENVLMASSRASGSTIIRNAAAEPHVVDLCHFLEKLGVGIEGIGTSTLKVIPQEEPRGATHTIRPDHIEVGTFAILAAVTASKIKMSPVLAEDLKVILPTLSQFGVKYELKGDKITVVDGQLKAVPNITTGVWPGFPTDLMAQTIVLATQAKGTTILNDQMYESRMFFVEKLISMGAKIKIVSPHQVQVFGPTKLSGQKLATPDIRAGVAIVIAALAASGTSVIDKAQLIERGYENLVERLRALSAEIKHRG